MAFTYKQSVVATSGLSATLPGISTSGDIAVFGALAFSSFGASAPTMTVTDPAGNTWLVVSSSPTAIHYAGTYYIYLFIAYALNISAPGSPLVITASLAPAQAVVYTWAIEYGAPAGSLFDPTSYGSAIDNSANTLGMPVVSNLSNASELLVSFAYNLSVSGVANAPWVQRQGGASGVQILDQLSGPAAGSQTLNPSSQTSINQWEDVVIAFYTPATPPPSLATKLNPTTYMRLLAQQNKVLGGPGAKTTDNEFTLIARNNVLLGGKMASPADTVFSLLSRQNKLLGGPGARAGDSEFSLYCRNLKLLGGSPNTNDNVITLLTKINNVIHHP